MDLRSIPGVCFLPTDGQLVEHYLHNWAHGLPLSSSDAIAVADVYSTEPWNLVPNGQDEAFFFSKRSLKNPNSKGGRAARTAGNGCWRLEKKKEEEVLSETSGLVVGTKSFLTFAFQGCKNYGWTMYEYLLKTSDGSSSSAQQRVLCRIKKSSQHHCKKRKREEDHSDCVLKRKNVVGHGELGFQQSEDQETACFFSQSTSSSSPSCSVADFEVADGLFVVGNGVPSEEYQHELQNHSSSATEQLLVSSSSSCSSPTTASIQQRCSAIQHALLSSPCSASNGYDDEARQRIYQDYQYELQNHHGDLIF